MRQVAISSAIAGFLVAASPAFADATADITVDKGSIVSIELVVEITTALGTDIDADSASKTFTGQGVAIVDSDIPPFMSLDLPSLSFDLGSAEFNYEFFCLPVIGCQSLDVTVSNFMIGLDVGGVSGPVVDGTASYPNAPFVSTFDYSVRGLADIDGSNVVPEIYPFSTDVGMSGADLLITDITLEPIVFEIPPEDLPPLVGPVVITANVNLDQATMSGLLVPGKDDCEGDFNDDGAVNGADFGAMLSAWGPCVGCPEDLNGDGVVSGADVGAFLALWGPCP